MNNPFFYTPEPACGEAFRRLVARLDNLRKSESAADRRFIAELEAGKMLGVLIAEDADGVRHTLYAFSGQLGDGGFDYPGFVGPVFDYLQPDGDFRSREREISRMNEEIACYERDVYSVLKTNYDHEEQRINREIIEFKERCRLSKAMRDERRKQGLADESELAEMIRKSQFEKAELHRLRKRLAAELEQPTAELEKARCRLAAMKERRRAESESLQEWLFSNFRLLNGRGESRNLREIFADAALRIPPSGAGECCGPKLLQSAYLRGWRPLAMAEYWYGRPKRGEVRRHGEHYPACRGKCLPVLGWMLQGLEVEPPLDENPENTCNAEPRIIYENEWFCVVDKPSGMLSVPGKGGAMSVQRWLEERYGEARQVKMAHRLDQDTSGLIMAAFGAEAFKTLQSLFARRMVKKTYIAELEGDYELKGIPRSGRINLPLSPDWLDRPRQRVDFESGKEAVTEYEFIGVEEGRSRVRFSPLTGRTHQLRVHSASEQGLGMPIAGDRLYGENGGRDGVRLHLHAEHLEFIFPMDSRCYGFDAPPAF